MYSAQGYRWFDARGVFYSHPGVSIGVCRNRFRCRGRSLVDPSPSKVSHSGHSVRAIIGQAREAELSQKGQTRTLTVWDTSLLAPRREQMAQTTCSECNAQYNSERELRDHLATAHRKFGTAQSSFTPRNKIAGALAAPANRPPN
jgi:hypothetical protein